MDAGQKNRRFGNMKCFFKGLLFLIISTLVTATGSWAGSTKHASIFVESKSWDFGFVPIDYKVIHIYTIKNVGQSDLRISKLVPNCDCTMAIASDTLLPPDSSTQIKIIFHTRDYYGQTNRNVTVHSNDPEKPTITLEYLSNIGLFPKLYQVAPRSLFFLPGHEIKEIGLINKSEEDINYSLEMEPDSIFSIDRSKGKLKSGNRVILNVTPKENLPRGTYHSNFIVTYDSEPKARITVPVKIVRY